MKTIFIFLVFALAAYTLHAQIGVGTTSPNSTLDVRGSMSGNYRAFTGSTTAGTDYTLVFTGTSAATLTLPDASTITGRMYWIKNASSNASVLTIATTSAQTIDGLASWSLTQTNKSLVLISNGTNWYATSESLPGNSAGTAWLNGGNAVASQQNIGTTSNFHLPFITNNTEKMRLTSTGNLGIGTSTFNASFPERLLADASATGNTNYQNVIVGKGNTNSYAQLNIQNSNNGTAASSDVVATADNGNETVNYIDMGVNGSGNTSTGALGGANTAYLYSTGNDFSIGNSANSKNLNFFTTTGGTPTERMRIDANGNVGIGTSTIPDGGIGMARLAIEGSNGSSSGPHVQFTTSLDSYPLLQVLPWQHDNVSMTFDGYWDGSNWKSSTTTGGNFNFFKNSGKFALRYANVNTQGSTITTFNDGIVMDVNGSVGVNASAFNGTYPEKLLVDAGSSGNTNYQNVIVGKGNTNSYAQLNIQNSSTGTAASSDVVATANNGNESVNYIDMGINGGGNTSAGILGAANNAYLYATGNDFVIGNSTENKDLIFYTTVPTATSTERMRVTGNGLKVSGSLTMTYRSGTGNYTLLATDYVVINTGAAATWTLPVASGCPGRVYRLLNQGTGSLTLSQTVRTASATTSTTLIVTAGSNYYEILSDGTEWRRIN